jgi:hypothetical protein
MDAREELRILRRIAELEGKGRITDNLTAEALNPAAGMSGMEKFAAGAGKAIVDTGRGLGQMVGLVSRDDVAESRRRDAPLMNTGAGMAGNIGGNVMMALSPGMALKGASAIPALAGAAPALNAAGTALMAPRTIGGAAALGAGMGAVQPSTSTGETIGNTAIGGIASASIPLVMRGLQSAKAAAEPFYQAGQDRILGRLLQKVAGGEAPEVANRLRESSRPFVGPSLPGEARATMGEIVPGSVPTMGQAAGNPGIAALERTLTATNPEVSQAVGARMAAQNTARADALGNMAGADGARQMFGEARDATAEVLYGKAFRKGINEKAAAKLQPQIAGLMENPAIQDAIPIAKRLARFDNVAIDNPAGSLQGLHYVKKALDDILDKGKQTGIGKIEAAKIAQTKDQLLGLMDKLSPAYATARAEFQAASRPLNQMDIAQEIADRSINRLTGTVQPSAFARALDDSTAARATGFRGATLENSLEPRQLAQLQAIREDLIRANAAQNAGRGPGSDTIQKLAYSNMVDAAGVPSWLRNMTGMQVAGNLAGRGADAIYGRANREMANRLAEASVDPSAIANLLTIASQTPRVPYSNALARAGASGGLALPGIINARKE